MKKMRKSFYMYKTDKNGMKREGNGRLCCRQNSTLAISTTLSGGRAVGEYKCGL
jgi:hypothetical protein